MTITRLANYLELNGKALSFVWTNGPQGHLLWIGRRPEVPQMPTNGGGLARTDFGIGVDWWGDPLGREIKGRGYGVDVHPVRERRIDPREGV